MQDIQPAALSDDEFERAVYMALNSAGALPQEVAQELGYRLRHGGRDKEKQHAATNPTQLNLPFNE